MKGGTIQRSEVWEGIEGTGNGFINTSMVWITLIHYFNLEFTI